MATKKDDFTQDIDGLRKLADVLDSSSKSLQDFDRTARQVLGSNFRRSIRAAERDLEDAVNRASQKIRREVERAGGAQAYALRKVGQSWGSSIADSLLSTLTFNITAGLPAVLKPLAMIAAPLNQINKIQVEGYKIVSNVAAAYGQLLPSSISRAQQALGNLDLTYTKIANRYGQIREDVDATRDAILRNTVVQSKNIVEIEKTTESYTEQIAAMSKLHGIGMPELTEQLIQQHKSLNDTLDTAAQRYTRVAIYAKEAGIGQQYLIQTANNLSVSLKSSGAEFENVSLFIASATKNLEKFGLAERVAMDAAESAIRGISGIGMGGVSMLLAQSVIPGLQKVVASGVKLSKEAESGILTAANAIGRPGEAPITDLEDALRRLSQSPAAGSLLMATTFNQSREAFQAVQSTMNKLFPSGGAPAVYGAGIFGIRGPQDYLAFRSAMEGGAEFRNRALSEGTSRELLNQASNMSTYLEAASEVGRSQLTVLEKMERYVEEIKRNQTILIAATIAGVGLTGLGVFSKFSRDYKSALGSLETMLGRSPTGRFPSGGRFAGNVATTVAEGQSLRGVAGSASRFVPIAIGSGTAVISGAVGALTTTKESTSLGVLGGAGMAGLSALSLSGGNPIIAGLAASGYEIGAAAKLLYEFGKESKATNQALLTASENLSQASRNIRFREADLTDKESAALASIYGGIQARATGSRSGKKIDEGYLMSTYGDLVSGDKQKMSEMLQRLHTISAKEKEGKVAAKVYDPMTGKEVVIYVSNVGANSAASNNVVPPTPTGEASLR